MILSNECWIKDSCRKSNKFDCTSDNCFCMKLFKLDKLYNDSLLSMQQRKHITLGIDADGTDYDEFNKLVEIEKNIVNFVNSGSNLYIHSSICGNGKTAWSIRMIQAYLNNVWLKSDMSCRALFINVPRFLLALKDSITTQNAYVQHIKDNVLNADLVVWDEVGIKNLTTYEHEHLLNLINTRIDIGKSNIYTSNLSPDELREKVGERLYSRIVNLSTDIEFHGQDKRGIQS